MAESRGRLAADNPTVLLGVVTLVSGVATGLFSDLRLFGQVAGLLAFGAWIVAIGLVLWNPESRLRPGSALSQLGDQFVHVELFASGCERAGEDIRIRSEDLRAVLP